MPARTQENMEVWRNQENGGPDSCCPSEVEEELRSLAANSRDTAGLSLVLFGLLRKQIGKPLGMEILRGIQSLATVGEAAGARLLAAMLEVAAPAERLLPLVINLSSSRRLWLGRLRDDPDPGLIMAEWKNQFLHLADSCHDALETKDLVTGIPTARIGWEQPWGCMRSLLATLVQHALAGRMPDLDSRRILVDLLRLEINAWQERISFLAGNMNPYRVAAVSRVLPLLSHGDTDIRDLQYVVQLIEDGQDEEAFLKSRLRALEILEPRELEALNRALNSDPMLGPLAELFGAQQDRPLPVSILAHGVARIQAWVSRLRKEGLRTTDLDLLSACRLVLAHRRKGEVVLPVPAELVARVAQVLDAQRSSTPPGAGPDGWPLDGVELQWEHLVIALPEAGASPASWPEFLPTPQDQDPLVVPASTAAVKPAATSLREQPAEPENDLTAAGMSNLVLANIQSTSLILGFLRNPKFVGIPGLVESVAVRTRNPRVIETIAVDRTLHAGFANRGVPLACLRSPVNVSVKILRRFIHVKFISKNDLKRLALDRAGVRKEVIREIEKYLAALA